MPYKPCAKCGSKIITNGWHDGLLGLTKNAVYHVIFCWNCQNSTNKLETFDEAYAEWNAGKSRHEIHKFSGEANELD